MTCHIGFQAHSYKYRGHGEAEPQMKIGLNFPPPWRIIDLETNTQFGNSSGAVSEHIPTIPQSKLNIITINIDTRSVKG